MSGYLVPNVIQRSGNYERVMDIFSRLLEDRIIMLTSPINDDTATIIIAQLLYLESENVNTPINIYINSPGGQVDSALAIYDTIMYIRAPVYTTVMGLAASAATIISTCGAPGHRYILPNARMMIHQPLGGTSGQFADIKIQFEQMHLIHERIIDLYIKHTGQKCREHIRKELDRDNYFSPERAIQFGLVDSIRIREGSIAANK